VLIENRIVHHSQNLQLAQISIHKIIIKIKLHYLLSFFFFTVLGFELVASCKFYPLTVPLDIFALVYSYLGLALDQDLPTEILLSPPPDVARITGMYRQTRPCYFLLYVIDQLKQII
jgi:hypothetical protein